ncbi:hypothetical protein B0H10DRAFT_1957598 [Mycena sp. CBHHK59/15]|nr:hypothetical protein B0H10DRAFT_1957598 [Mycena sp. CBHHK59/15]
MSNRYTFVALCVLFALNEKQLVGAAPQLDPRQDSSPSYISASSSTSLLQSSSAATAISSTAASSATALPMYTSSNRALPGRDIILSSSNTDAEVWEQTCNTSLTSVSFNLGLFPFSACQSIFDVLHNLTEYQYYNTSKFYQVNPEVKLLFFGVQNPPTNFNEQINPGCKNLRDQTDYCLTELDSDAIVTEISYSAVPSDGTVQNPNGSEAGDSCGSIGGAYKFSDEQFAVLNPGKSCDAPEPGERVIVRKGWFWG